MIIRANGCAYFSALLILEANLIEYPLHENVEADLRLTGFAVEVLNQMSSVSSVMAMKRMNLVAAELDRQSRRIIDQARQAKTTDTMSSSAEPFEETNREANRHDDTLTGLKWDWGNNGGEAWPSMDFTIVSNCPAVYSTLDAC